MSARVRYQGAILRDDEILLIQHREHATGRAYWIIPGGKREAGESEPACVVREMREETNLDVRVERLLLDDSDASDKEGHRAKTYVCRVVKGEPQPGYEPEIHASQHYGIVQVKWFDLRYPDQWDTLVRTDAITFPLMQRIRDALGYPSG